MSAAAYPHIEHHIDGPALIAGTTMKVVELVREHLAWDWDAPQLRLQHPYLSLGQIHGALAYFYDHEAELRSEIDRCEREAEEFCARMGTNPLTEKLRSEKLRRTQGKL